MRVAQNNLYNTSIGQIQKTRNRMMDVNEELSTQKRINQPSDDPVGAAKILKLRTSEQNLLQFQNTNSAAEIFLNYTDHALEDLTNVINHAKELAISQSSDASANADSRMAIAEDVEQLFAHTVSIGNRKLGDRFIFGGFKTTKEPFNIDGDYKGDNGLIKVEIQEDVYIPMNVAGSEVFQGKGYKNADSSINSNVFDILRSLHTGLMTNDTKIIQGTLDRLEGCLSRVIQVRARVGARAASVSAAKGSLGQSLIDGTSLKSEIEDADIVKAASEITKEQDILHASLNATQRLLQPSLMDFLK
jgi:flagellar hook-associated protein 3 FlgL